MAPANPALSCSLQLLLGALLRSSANPQLARLPRGERLALTAAAWPQLWALQLAQSGADPRALVSDRLALLSAAVAGLATAAAELRALAPDPTEWGMVEGLAVAGGAAVGRADGGGGDGGDPLVRRRRELKELAHVSLARYHLVARPADPARLPRLLLAVGALSQAATQENVVR